MDANMKRSSRSDISVRGANHKEAKTKQKPNDNTKAETLFLYLHPTAAAAVVLLAGGGVSRSRDAPLLGRLVPLTRLTGVEGHSPLTFAEKKSRRRKMRETVERVCVHQCVCVYRCVCVCWY